MTYAQMMLEYVRNNPGATTADVAKAINYPQARVATGIAQLCMPRSDKPPRMRREVKYMSASNTPVYSYFVNDGRMPAQLPQRPKERAAKSKEHVVTNMDQGITLDALADQLARQFAMVVANRVKHHLTAVMQPEALLPPTQGAPIISLADLQQRMMPAPVADKKKMILIAGLLPMQAGIIDQEFNDVFDFKFFTSDDNLHKLRDMLQHVDYVFTFTSKISHKVEDVIKSEGKRIFRCYGGLSMLKDQLTKLYAEGEV